MSSDWNKLKVAELRAELESRGLSSKGRKAELVARLEEAEAGGEGKEEGEKEEKEMTPRKREREANDEEEEEEEEEEEDDDGDDGEPAAEIHGKKVEEHEAADEGAKDEIEAAGNEEKSAPEKSPTKVSSPGAKDAPLKEKKSVLYVSGLVRPFSEGAIRKWLQEDGEIARLHLSPTKAWALVEYVSAECAQKAWNRVNGAIWPPKNNQAVTAALFSSWDEAMESREAASAQKVRKTDTPKSQKVDPPKAAAEPAPVADIDSLFKQTKFEPPLYYTIK